MMLAIFQVSLAQDQQALDSLTRIINKPKDNDQKLLALIDRAYLFPPRDLDKSIRDLEQAEKLAISVDNLDKLAGTYNAYGNLLSAAGEYAEAVTYFRKAHGVAVQIPNHRFIAIAQANIGSNYAWMSEKDSALLYFDIAERSYLNLTPLDSLLLLKHYSNVGVFHRRVGEYDQALVQYDKALNMLKGNEYHPMLNGLYTNKGNVLMLQNKTEEAIELFFKSLRISEQNKDSLRMATVNASIGLTFSRIKEYESARQYTRTAKQLADKLGLSSSNHFYDMNLAGSYKDLGMVDSADYWYAKALAIAERINNPSRLAVLYQNYGNFLVTQNQFIYAESFLQKALALFEEQEVHVEVAAVFRSLAFIRYKTGHALDAQQFIARSYDLAAKHQVRGITLHGLNALSAELSLVSQDYQKAYEFKAKQYEMAEDAYSNDKRTQILKTENQYKIEQREAEIQLAKQKQQKLRFQMISGAGVFLLIAGLVYIFLRIKRKREAEKHQAALIQMEQQHRIDSVQSLREAEEEERKKIANKLHDEVGALLSIAKLNVDQLEEDVFVADSDATNKIQTAGKLLGEVAESVRNISHTLMPVALEKYGLKSAIHDLTSSLQASGKIKVEEVIEGLEDTAAWPKDFVLGVYRIVQEALNNVIKHAEASHILIQLVELDDAVTIYIEDNGRGILAENVAEGLGMRLLQRNVEYFNGTIEINGNPSDGTFVLVELKKGWI